MICEYGCGREAKYQFKNGKWCCEEKWPSCSNSRKRSSESHKGLTRSASRVITNELCDYGCGREAKYQFKNGKWCCENKYMKCPKHIEKISRIMKGKDRKPFSEEHKKNLSEAHKGENHHFYGVPHSKEHNRKISVALKGRQLPEEHKRKISKSCKGKIRSEETRIRMKKKFLDKDFCKKFFQVHRRKPNKKEVFIKELLDSIFPEDYIYTGDFSVMIGGKNPDFVDEEGNKIIEFFGDHWHTGKFIKESTPEEHEKNRINHFKKYGYNTLIIWQHELKDLDSLKTKIKNFNEENKLNGVSATP